MKKLFSVIAGIGVFVLIICGFKLHMNAAIEMHAAGVRNHRTYERFWSRDAQKHIIEDDTLVVFGSSELVPLSDMDENISSFLNGDDMNIVTMGSGNFQSLSHTMTLGAISDYISAKKVALFLSPQWFVQNGVDAAAFPARMSEDELLGFLNNSKISDEHKDYVLDRAVALLEGSPAQLKRVQRYQNAHRNKLTLDTIYFKVMNQYWRFRSEFEIYKQLDEVNDDVPVYNLSKMDFEKILQKAELQGKKACTNNDFGINDEYWNTYAKEKFDEGEILEKSQVFTESIEYSDLDCFLDVAKELGIEVLLVCIPVNERWYTYKGLLCDEYYHKIANVVADHENVTFIDMSEYAGEKYFLKDVMHLGWKGWTRINERLYQEFTKQ